MKKLVLCLVLVLCFFGCSFDNTIPVTIKNTTDVIQTINILSVNRDFVDFFTVEPGETVIKKIPRGYYKEIKPSSIFDRQFDFTFKDDIWVIVDAGRTTYTIKSELDFDITVQNFNIVNGAKSNPCYSVFIPNNSSINIATIDVYPEWLGNIWDLENRNIDNVSDYETLEFQSLIINNETVYYEIIKKDKTVLIRYR